MINTFVGTVYSICSLARMKFLTFSLNFISFSNLTAEIIRVVLNDRQVTTLNLRSSCSFLILVDYTFVLNLDKVDSVKH